MVINFKFNVFNLTFLSFTADKDIQVSGLGIYGIAPNVKPHIMYVDEKASTTWNCQVEIQVKFDFPKIIFF